MTPRNWIGSVGTLKVAYWVAGNSTRGSILSTSNKVNILGPLVHVSRKFRV